MTFVQPHQLFCSSPTCSIWFAQETHLRRASGESRTIHDLPVLQLISPVQLGRLIILAYPWFPDTLALTSWLAADAGDQQAASFFSAGSQTRLPHQMSAPFCLSIASRGSSGD